MVQNLGEDTAQRAWYTLPADLLLDDLGSASYLDSVSFISGYPWDYMMGIVMTEDVAEPDDSQAYYMTNRYRY